MTNILRPRLMGHLQDALDTFLTRPRLTQKYTLPRIHFHDVVDTFDYLKITDGAHYQFVGIVAGIDAHGDPARYCVVLEDLRLLWHVKPYGNYPGRQYLSGGRTVRAEVRIDWDDGSKALLLVAREVMANRKPVIVRFIARMWERVMIDITDLAVVFSVSPEYDAKLTQVKFPVDYVLLSRPTVKLAEAD